MSAPQVLPLSVAVLGTGNMGFPVARRLAQAGFGVRAWNRTRARAAPLAQDEDGITVCDEARAAVQGVDCAISLLENGDVVEQVLFGQGGVAAALPAGSLFVDMASIQPRKARAHAARLRDVGVRYLDAPVSGGTVGAAAGTLSIMAGGAAGDFAQAAALFAALGRATLVGPHGSGQLAKIANQMIVGASIAAVAEALLLAERGGADPARVREAISGGFADSRVLQLHGARMVQRDFAPHGRLAVQLKDLRNAAETAAELGFDAPVTALCTALYEQAAAHGLGEVDHSGLYLELARRNAMQA